MGRRIELPQLPAGQPQEQLQALYSYLYQMADALNNNLAEIGNGDFTDDEMAVVRQITGKTETGNNSAGMAEAETLKSLIIKTAQLIKTEIDQYNLKLIGNYEADGKLGRYVRKTKLDVDVTPTGIQQNYSFQEIIQGLKTYEINAKNYIKTGLLRTEGGLPVYGVAIGKDVVTFAEDGTETYNDGNKVAELTADELSFWQGGNKVAGYTGTAIIFYSGGSKMMELAGTELSFYANGTKLLTINSSGINALEDLMIGSGKKINIGSWEITDDEIKLKTTGKEFSIIPGSYYAVFKIKNTTTNEQEYVQMWLDQLKYTPAFTEAFLFAGCLQTVELTASDIDYINLHQMSSREIKHDIRDMESPGEKLDRLRPVTFVYDEDPDEKTRQGLIYEETIDVMPEICTGIESAKAINYVELIPVFLKEIQELRARVKALEERGGETDVRSTGD